MKTINLQSGSKTNYNLILYLLLLVLTLTPFFILSFYNYPQIGDDYTEAVVTLKKGIFGAQKWWYFNFEGRYMESIFISLNPLVFNAFWVYKLIAIVFLLLLLISIYRLCGKIFQNLDNTGKIGISALFIFAYIREMPDASHGIFSYTKLIDNLLPDILTILLLGCIISYYQSTFKRRYLILSCLLVIVIIGCYDIHMLFIDLIIFTFAFIGVLKKKKLFFPLILLAIGIIFSISSISAPGNTMRGLLYPNTHNILFSARMSFVVGLNLIIHWLPFMLLISLFLFDILSKSVIYNEKAETLFIIQPWFSLMACIAAPFIGLFICFWAMGDAPTYTWNGIYFYFVTGMFYFSFSSVAHIKKRYPDFRMPYFVKFSACLIIVYMIFFKPNNITKTYKDIISGTASAYNREMILRHESLTTFKGDSCLLDSIRNIPNSFAFLEIPRPSNDSIWNYIPFDKFYHAINTGRVTGAWGYPAFHEYYHKKYIGIKGR